MHSPCFTGGGTLGESGWRKLRLSNPDTPPHASLREAAWPLSPPLPQNKQQGLWLHPLQCWGGLSEERHVEIGGQKNSFIWSLNNYWMHLTGNKWHSLDSRKYGLLKEYSSSKLTWICALLSLLEYNYFILSHNTHTTSVLPCWLISVLKIRFLILKIASWLLQNPSAPPGCSSDRQQQLPCKHARRPGRAAQPPPPPGGEAVCAHARACPVGRTGQNAACTIQRAQHNGHNTTGLFVLGFSSVQTNTRRPNQLPPSVGIYVLFSLFKRRFKV